MDELEKEVIKATVDAALAPVTRVAADIIGWGGGDWIAHKRRMAQERREKNTRDTAQRAKALLDQRGVESDPETATEHVEQILDAAADESHDEIKELFSRLLAAAVDPKRRANFRRELVDVVRQFEPIDALVLTEIANDSLSPSKIDYIVEKLKRSRDEVYVSFQNLDRLGLLLRLEQSPSPGAPAASPRARQLLALLAG